MLNGSSEFSLVSSRWGGPVAAVLSKSLAVTWKSATLPWHLTLRWLAYLSSLLVNLLTALGAPPVGYVPDAKVPPPLALSCGRPAVGPRR